MRIMRREGKEPEYIIPKYVEDSYLTDTLTGILSSNSSMDQAKVEYEKMVESYSLAHTKWM